MSSFVFYSYVFQRCGPPGPSSHGVLCCWLPFRVVFHLALLSSAFGVRVSSSSSFVVSVPVGGLLPLVVLLPCTVRALPLFLLMGFFFSLVLLYFPFSSYSFSSPFSCCPRFFVRLFLQVLLLVRRVLLFSGLLFLLLFPGFLFLSSFLGSCFGDFGVSLCLGLSVTLCGLLFWEDSLWSSSSVLASLCLFFHPFSSSGFLPFGVLCWLRLPDYSFPSFI